MNTIVYKKQNLRLNSCTFLKIDVSSVFLLYPNSKKSYITIPNTKIDHIPLCFLYKRMRISVRGEVGIWTAQEQNHHHLPPGCSPEAEAPPVFLLKDVCGSDALLDFHIS